MYISCVRFFGTMVQKARSKANKAFFHVPGAVLMTPFRYLERLLPKFAPNSSYMKKLMIPALLSCLLLTGCAVSQKTEMSKFTADINVVKSYRPDLYDKYMKGEIVIDDVYLDQTTACDYYGVDYHYVKFEPYRSVK